MLPNKRSRSQWEQEEHQTAALNNSDSASLQQDKRIDFDDRKPRDDPTLQPTSFVPLPPLTPIQKIGHFLVKTASSFIRPFSTSIMGRRNSATSPASSVAHTSRELPQEHASKTASSSASAEKESKSHETTSSFPEKFPETQTTVTTNTESTRQTESNHLSLDEILLRPNPQIPRMKIPSPSLFSGIRRPDATAPAFSSTPRSNLKDPFTTPRSTSVISMNSTNRSSIGSVNYKGRDSSRASRLSSNPSATPTPRKIHGGIQKKYKLSSYSVVKDQITRQREQALATSMKRYIPGFDEAVAGGFEGDIEQYRDFCDYAQRVASLNPDFTRPNFTLFKPVAENAVSPPVPTKKASPSSKIRPTDMSWMKGLQEKIQKIQTTLDESSRIRSARPMPLTPTPKYDALLCQDQAIEDSLRRLRMLPEPKYRRNNFPDFKPDMVDVIKAAKCKKVGPIISAFKVDLQPTDIATLRDGQWLNDEIINFYGNLCMQRAESDPTKYPKIHYFNTFFYVNYSGNGYQRVRRWTKAFDLFSKDLVFIPIHKGDHWCMSVINLKQKRFEYYDSLHGGAGRVLSHLRSYLEEEWKDKKKTGTLNLDEWTDFCPNNCPGQQNGYDCGVFTCLYMEYISRDEPFDFSQKHMPYLRNRIVYEIAVVDLINKLE